MSETPYMQLWVADFLGDTLHLSADEIGQYMLLLMASWRAGGFLSSDRSYLERVCRGPVSDAVLAFFDEKDGEISQKRLLAELTRAKHLRNIRKEAGAKGGKAKALKSNDGDLANAKQVLKQKRSIPEPVPLATNVANRGRAKALPPDWKPSPENQKNLSEKYALHDLERELEKFRDHFAANGKRMKDWDAAFRNWMRRCNEFRRGPGPPKDGISDAVGRVLDEIEGRKDARAIG